MTGRLSKKTEHHAEGEFAVCCLTLVKGRNWEALWIGEMMLRMGYSQTFHGVEGETLFVETEVPFVEADELGVVS